MTERYGLRSGSRNEMTTRQLSFTDIPPEVLEARDQAIDQVEEHSANWVDRAVEIVRRVAKTREHFTTDDLWERIPGGDETLSDPRAMGAVMRRAAREGLVLATDYHRPSSRRECHGRPLRVWVSLLWKGDKCTKSSER